ncbi:MAG: hypothetical protein ACRC62_28060 [Microcoleus sp.]
MTDFPINISLDQRDLTDLALLVMEVTKSGRLKNYSDFYRYHRNKTAERYRIAAARTPYAASSKGRTKKVSKRKIPDGFFGIDSGALFSDTVNNRKITPEDGLIYYSDLSYSAYVMAKFAEKGPYAPDDVLFVNDEDLGKLEEIVSENYARAFG